MLTAVFNVRCPHLLTKSDASPPKVTCDENLAATLGLSGGLASTSRPPIIPTHFYDGGLVTLDAITEAIYATESKNSGVVQFIYISAWGFLPGKFLLDRFNDMASCSNWIWRGMNRAS